MSERGRYAERAGLRGAASSPLPIRDFRNALLRVVVGVAIAVMVVGCALSYRLAASLAHEREAALMAQDLLAALPSPEPDALWELRQSHGGQLHLGVPVEGSDTPLLPVDWLLDDEIPPDAIHFEHEPDSETSLVWGYQSDSSAMVAWAFVERGGQRVALATQPLQQTSAAATVSATIRLVFGGAILSWLAFWSGIYLIRRVVDQLGDAAQRLNEAAFTDALTGLPNRYEFERLLNAHAEEDAARGAALLLDINNFKDVNDALGHSAGDEVLVAVAARLNEQLPDDAFCARFGGDEFVVWLPDAPDRDPLELAETFSNSLATPLCVRDLVVRPRVSIGLDTFPGTATSVEQLLTQADVAMHASKAAGTGPVIYEPALDATSTMMLALRADLEAALRDGAIEVHYQPKYCLERREWCGLEALARWTHPTEGAISPAVFVGLAERTGMIGDLTLYVLRQVCADQRTLMDAGLALPIAVNLSALLLHHPRLVEDVVETLRGSGIDACMVDFELTETAAMRNLQLSQDTLNDLVAAGFRIAIDDFGTGLSSLAYLHKLPVRAVKIDRSFVSDFEQEPADGRAAHLINAIIAVAQRLGFEVIAEGVELRATVDRLRAAGCHSVQGFGLGRPMPVDAVVRWLRSECPERRAG